MKRLLLIMTIAIGLLFPVSPVANAARTNVDKCKIAPVLHSLIMRNIVEGHQIGDQLHSPHDPLSLRPSRTGLCLLTSSTGLCYLTLSRWIDVG